MAPNLREGMRPALEEPLGDMGPEGRDGTGVGAGRDAHGLTRERGKLTELPDTPDSPRGNPRRCSQAPRQEPRPARGKACGDREKVITEKLPEPSVGGQAMCSAQATLSWTWPTSIPEGACSGKSTTQAQKEFSYWFIQLFTPETLTESLLRSQITDRRGQWPRPPRPQSLEREAAHPVPTTTGGGGGARAQVVILSPGMQLLVPAARWPEHRRPPVSRAERCGFESQLGVLAEWP